MTGGGYDMDGARRADRGARAGGGGRRHRAGAVIAEGPPHPDGRPAAGGCRGAREAVDGGRARDLGRRRLRAGAGAGHARQAAVSRLRPGHARDTGRGRGGLRAGGRSVGMDVAAGDIEVGSDRSNRPPHHQRLLIAVGLPPQGTSHRLLLAHLIE